MAHEIRHDAARSRYELVADGEVIGTADYVDDGERVVFPHTVIRTDLRGQGFGAVLVRAALDDVRQKGRSVVPRCWYVAQFIDEHAEYRDLVA
jgi:uncharacterized protein